jgi:peptidoglycan-associated lipoprotein
MTRFRCLPTIVLCGSALLAACAKTPPAPTTPAVDSTAIRARADSVAAAARRDSLAAAARRDSLERARADSLAAALERARADSIRAQVQRGDTTTAALMPSGLDRARDSVLALPIYFETDRAVLTAEAQRRLDAKIEVLRAFPRLQVEVQGHCDERGPDEYNLALGNRRAAALKRYLGEHGVAAARLTVISYGEERPADPGHTEQAWARNRRGEFRVTRGAR